MDARYDIYKYIRDRVEVADQHIIFFGMYGLSRFLKLFSKFPNAGRLVIWEPRRAVDLLQFLSVNIYGSLLWDLR